MAEKNDQLV